MTTRPSFGLKKVIPGVGKSIKVQADEIDDSLIVRTPGLTFYVDPDNGDDNAHNGLDWGHAFATIGKALDESVDARGDTIYVTAGSYDENLVIDKAYVTLVGVQINRYGRPDVVPSSGKALVVSAQGFVAINMRFAAPAEDTDLILHQSNGGKYINCVFDGDATMGDAKALLRLKGVTDDDSYTASENLFEDCLFRGSGGFGVAFDVGDGGGNQVGATDNVFRNCTFRGNDKEDVMAVDTSLGGVYSAVNNTFDDCKFLERNKATFIDVDTTNGATNTGNSWTGCFFWDDTIDGTAIKVATANGGIIGCYGLDGVIDGDALD